MLTNHTFVQKANWILGKIQGQYENQNMLKNYADTNFIKA